MTVFQAVILGIIQGLTEFFPISSSGHLVIFQYLLGLEKPRLAFDIFLHLGTLLSILIFFRKDILGLFTGDRRFLFFLALASAPTFIIGFIFKDKVEILFGMPKAVGAMLILTGVWLFLAVFLPKYIKSMANNRSPRMASALMVGIAQGIAIVPGISRSGATIATGMLAGMEKEIAFKFSLLLSIPAVLGALFLKAFKINEGLASGEALTMLAGGIAAMLTGLFAIKVLLRIVKNNRLYIFGAYLVIAGALVMMIF